MAIQIQLRRDTTTNWTNNNPTLANGEMGIDTDQSKFKIGDGGTAWNDLDFVGVDTDADAIHDDVAGEIEALGEKATPVDNDIFLIEDSEDSDNKKKVLMSNILEGITPIVWSAASDPTPDINSDYYDAVTITALAADITDVNMSGTPTDFQKLLFRIKDDGSSRSITWGADFQNGSVELPTETTASKTLLVGVIYDSVDSKWTCEASGSRA